MNRASLLEGLIHELDPRRDFDRVGYLSDLIREHTGSFKETVYSTMRVAYAAANLVKHGVRGAVVGAAAGVLVGMLADTDIGNAAKAGAAIGERLDALQYLSRSMLYKPVKSGLSFGLDYLNHLRHSSRW